MSAPAPYPVVQSSAPAPDDHEITTRTPSICVDYLSHNWTDEDVWSSWKAMTKVILAKNRSNVSYILLLAEKERDCQWRPSGECQLENMGKTTRKVKNNQSRNLELVSIFRSRVVQGKNRVVES